MNDIPSLTNALAAHKAITDALRSQDQECRASLGALAEQVGLRAATFDVTAPDGTPLAVVSRTSGRVEAKVTDPAAWLTWVRRAHPSEVATRTEEYVRQAWQKAFLDELAARGEAIDAEGTRVPGVVVTVGEPGWRVVTTDEAAKRAAAAITAGDLPALLDRTSGTTLAIEPAT